MKLKINGQPISYLQLSKELKEQGYGLHDVYWKEYQEWLGRLSLGIKEIRNEEKNNRI